MENVNTLEWFCAWAQRNRKQNAAASDALLTRLAASDEGACLGILTALCRQSKRFRRWLWKDFSRKAGVRQRIAHALSDPLAVLPRRLAALVRGQGGPRRRTKRYHGGLTEGEVRDLIQHYEAGGIEPGVLQLVREWREAPQPATLWGALHFVAALLSHGRWRLLRHVSRAFTFLRRAATEGEREQRIEIGYVNWWKIQALTYVLKNPRRRYRVRELRAHLTSVGLNIEPGAIRRLCHRHEIRRDSRPGRPPGCAGHRIRH